MLKKLLLALSIFCLSHAKDLSNLDSRFVQRWNLMSICDFAYHNAGDSGTNGKPFRNDNAFNPKDVFPGAVIFLTGHGAQDFFKYIHPQIENPYIILYMFGGLYGPILDDPKIIHFFCGGGDGPLKNEHPKYSYVPIGIFREINVYHNQKNLNDFFLQLRTKEKQKLVYMNITLHPWATWRHEIYNLFKGLPYVYTCGRKGFVEYMGEMSDYKFTISPRGDVLDCYRHWEAIMVGSIPIMKRSAIDCMFEGLPVLFIDDWKEIAEMTEDALHEKYREIKSKTYDYSKLYMKYWVDQINGIKTAHGF